MNLNLRGLLRIVASFTLLVPTAAAQVGSGAIDGIFTDAQPTTPPEVLIVSTTNPPAGEDWATPRSSGSGTDHYQWGLWDTGKYFLDGVETPLGDITALGLTPEETVARVTKEVGPSENALAFTGLGFTNQPKGQSFVAGKLLYHNGVSHFGTPVGSVKLDVLSKSSSSDFNQVSPQEIAIRTSPNVLNQDGSLNQEASADFIYFVGRPELGSFRVYENEETDVEILMEFNSLDLVGFGAVGDPTVGFLATFVPEPSTASLAVMMLVLVKRRRPGARLPR